MLTNVKSLCTMLISRTFVHLYWGGYIMTDNEKELLNIINSHDDPKLALEIAIQTISIYLEQRESNREPSVVRSQALA